MSIRATITLLAVPLFLALALVNGALLYVQERKETAQLLHDQADAAAVTSAEFIAEMNEPLRTLTKPYREQALSAVARKLPDLNALYLVRSGAAPLALFASSSKLDFGSYQHPAATQIQSLGGESGGRYVVALAPATPDSFVIARIDAEPSLERLAQTWRKVFWIVLVAGLFAALLAWFVARRITAELRVSEKAIDGMSPDDTREALSIREAKELAGAVRLTKAHGEAAAERDRLKTERKDRLRTKESALLTWRQAEFAPLNGEASGRAFAIRMTDDASPGCFFALCKSEDQAAILIGRCVSPEPEDALASALAARRFLEKSEHVPPTEEDVALARKAFGIEELRILSWNALQPLAEADRFACVTDEANARRSAAYARQNSDAAPDDLLDAIGALLGAGGVFAATGPA